MVSMWIWGHTFYHTPDADIEQYWKTEFEVYFMKGITGQRTKEWQILRLSNFPRIHKQFAI